MRNETRHDAAVEVVVKLGGSVMSDGHLFDAALRAIDKYALRSRLLIVPGGGAFADAVRELDRRESLSDDAAHWMAVRAMDQSADVVAHRMADAVVVNSENAISNAHMSGRVPVLAPSHWLQESDPLPHSWDVTSDSIAAWIAGRLKAPHLVLIKPPGVGLHESKEAGMKGLSLVDRWFSSALPPGTRWTLVPADQVESAFES